MKNTLMLCLCLLAASVRAGITITNTLAPTTLAGTPTALVTNNSTPVIVGYASFRFNPNFVINQGGLNTTNSFTNYTKLSLDTNTAFGVVVSTNLFASTNAGSITVPAPNNQTIPIWGWTQTVVSNSTVVWQQVVTQTP